MGSISVNSISKKYEQLYKEFSEKTSKDESFYAINNAMIFAYFLQFIEEEYTRENEKECYNIIIEKYGEGLFFHNFKRTKSYKTNRNIAIRAFIELFSKDNGNSLEKILGHVLEKHVNRKDTGSYYTPNDTTYYMSQRTIIFLIIKKCENSLKEKIYRALDIKSVRDVFNINGDLGDKFLNVTFSELDKEMLVRVIYDLKIIDPTCGSGAFIVSALECIENLIKELDGNIDYNRLLSCLYGLDISNEAVQLTKVRLLMKIVNTECNIEMFLRMYAEHFKVADAIKGSDYVIEENGFDWKQFSVQFDCVIGNPPYVEASKYASDNFVTSKCGNLYAYTIERACNIASNDGMVAFIVPLPFVSTPRMQVAKRYLENCAESVFYGTYADRPGCIFTGVHQRLVIFFAEMGDRDECEIFSSSYKYWYKEERSDLFNGISYYPNEMKGILPKVGNGIEYKIYRKMILGENTLNDLWTKESSYPLYLSTRIGFWTKAFNKNVFSSKEYKEIFAKNEDLQILSLAILNSSAFYFLWVVSSDCWHITNKNIDIFKFDMDKVSKIEISKLKELVILLMNDLEKNKKFIGSKQTQYEYKHKFSKNIIDKIDECISPLIGLTQEELKYVTSYTEKYRINNVEV